MKSTMKDAVKAVLSAIPCGDKLVEIWRSVRPKDKEVIFTHYYANNVWGSTESVSGTGSEVECTEPIRREIPRLIEELAVKQILDAPCGDYNWFRLIHRKQDVHYLGADIVKPLIERKRKLFKNDTTDFTNLDITQDKLPEADLLICRDCLMHFSYQDIFKAIANFLRSDIRYLLTTTCTTCSQNTNIITGKCRAINLQLPPFSFPEPLRLISDQVQSTPVRELGLWKSKSLAAALASNKNLQQTGFPT